MPLKVRRESIKQIPGLIDGIRKQRDDYMVRYESALQDYQQTEKSLPERFLGKELAMQRQMNRDKFDSVIADLRSAFSDKLVKAVGVVETAVISEVGKPYTPDCISDLIRDNVPVSKVEFNILREQFSKGNYWTDKQFQVLADQNGITPDDLPCSADEMLSTLKSILSEADEFLERWQGDTETVPLARMLLHDRHLQSWEDGMTKGFVTPLTASQKATRVLASIAEGGSVFDTVRKIHVALANTASEPGVQNLILYGLSQDDRLYEMGCTPFLDADYRQILTEYRDGTRKPPQAEEKPVKLSPETEAVARSLTARAKEVRAELGDTALSHAYANSGSEAQSD